MAERTEEQILTQQAKKLTLGGKIYELKPMTMRKAFEWRAKVADNLAGIMEASTATPTRESLKTSIVSSPTEVVDTVSSYLGLTPEEKEQLLDTATEQEIILVFNSLMDEVFAPFLAQRQAAFIRTDPEVMLKAVDRIEQGVKRLDQLKKDQERMLQALAPPSTLQ